MACSEIADNPVLVARLKELYDALDVGTTPMTVLMPWLSTLATIKKLRVSKEVYDIVTASINAREQSGISRNDTLQMPLDSGDERFAAIEVSTLIVDLTDPGDIHVAPIVYYGSPNRWCTSHGNYCVMVNDLSWKPS